MKHFILLSWLLVSFLIMRNEALAGPGLCRATVNAPSWAEGKDIPCSSDLGGDTRSTLGTNIAGERLTNQATKSYLAVRNEANVSIISKTTAVTIGAGATGDTHLLGLMITAALTGTCVITGFGDSDGAAQSYTLPAATTAGYKDFLGALNSLGPLTITCSNAGDDNFVMVFWRPAL